MATSKDTESYSISETRFVIFIPLFITAICAWLDFVLSKQELKMLSVLKMIYTYFFPSIASTMITLIIQKACYKNDSCGIADNRVFLSAMLIVIYGVLFISCLSNYSMCTAMFFGVCSVLYMLATWFFCLDKKITHNAMDPEVKERAALKRAINEEK